jgi:hypothetical protein
MSVMMTIRLMIDVPHAASPHERTRAAIMALHDAVQTATEDQPALPWGGVLNGPDGKRVGSYLVEL